MNAIDARVCFLAAFFALPSLADWPDPAFIPGRDETVPTVVLIGGSAIERAIETFDKTPQASRRFNLYAMPLAKSQGANLVFPPAGTAYRENGESHALWRWLGLHAPDLVIVAGAQDFGLAEALSHNAVAGMGAIPALRITDPSADLLHAIPREIAPSQAHRERDRRLARTPRDVAMELAAIYGHDFDPPIYIPAMALIARLRLGQQSDVARIVAPYVDGTKDSLAKVTSSHFAGHLLFAELAERTGDQRYVARVQAAADLPFTDWNEMSDAIFMGCPILAAAGKLTGKSTYFDRTLDHFQVMQKLCLRPDGLYRHSPLNEAAWGRGNAFPALGLAWTLQYLLPSHRAYAPLLASFQQLIATLAKFQDRDGMWHELIDQPASYPEFSATAMIATAMLRGVSRGWLDRSYANRARLAWRAIQVRIGPGGALVDVCESTGKQKTVEDYLNRAASFGKDARGGGMAMLLATELDAAK